MLALITIRFEKFEMLEGARLRIASKVSKNIFKFISGTPSDANVDQITLEYYIIGVFPNVQN